MANNRDLLREAIADAKAVKETAIANAKAALTESLTPFLKEKLSQKITEMEEGYIDEEVYENAEENNENLDEISLDELLAEGEQETDTLSDSIRMIFEDDEMIDEDWMYNDNIEPEELIEVTEEEVVSPIDNEQLFWENVETSAEEKNEEYNLTKGAVFCELKDTDEGLNLVLKNYGFSNKHFTIKMDDNIVFQRLTSQELVILSALDHLSD